MIKTILREDLTYELTPMGGFKILNKGEDWIVQDGYIPPKYIRDTIEESAQAYIDDIIASQTQAQAGIADEDDLKRRVLALENRPHIHEMAHSFDAATNRHILSGEAPASGIFTVRFKATRRYGRNEEFYLQKEYHPCDMLFNDLDADVFVEGSIVEANVDVENGTIVISGIVPNSGAIDLTRLWKDERTGTAREQIIKDDAIFLYENGSILNGSASPIEPDITLTPVPITCAISKDEQYFAIGYFSSNYTNRMAWYKLNKEDSTYTKLPDPLVLPNGKNYLSMMEFSPNGKYLMIRASGTSSSQFTTSDTGYDFLYLYKIENDTLVLLPNITTEVTSKGLIKYAYAPRLAKWGPDNKIYSISLNNYVSGSSGAASVIAINTATINSDNTISLEKSVSASIGYIQSVGNMDISPDCSFCVLAFSTKSSYNGSVNQYGVRLIYCDSNSSVKQSVFLTPKSGLAATAALNPLYTIPRFSKNNNTIYVLCNESATSEANVLEQYSYDKTLVTAQKIRDVITAQEIDGSSKIYNFALNEAEDMIAFNTDKGNDYIYELQDGVIGKLLMIIPHNDDMGGMSHLSYADRFCFSKNYFCMTANPRIYQLNESTLVRKVSSLQFDSAVIQNGAFDAGIGVALQDANVGEECRVNLFPALNGALGRPHEKSL